VRAGSKETSTGTVVAGEPPRVSSSWSPARTREGKRVTEAMLKMKKIDMRAMKARCGGKIMKEPRYGLGDGGAGAFMDRCIAIGRDVLARGFLRRHQSRQAGRRTGRGRTAH